MIKIKKIIIFLMISMQLYSSDKTREHDPYHPLPARKDDPYHLPGERRTPMLVVLKPDYFKGCPKKPVFLLPDTQKLNTILQPLGFAWFDVKINLEGKLFDQDKLMWKLLLMQQNRKRSEYRVHQPTIFKIVKEIENISVLSPIKFPEQDIFMKIVSCYIMYSTEDISEEKIQQMNRKVYELAGTQSSCSDCLHFFESLNNPRGPTNNIVKDILSSSTFVWAST